MRAITAWAAIISAVLSVFLPVKSHAGVVVATVFSFDGTNGGNPDALIQGSGGSFYGTTAFFHGTTAFNSGTVFNLTQSGAMSVLATFNGTNGSDPVGPIVQTPDGSIYGTTYLGSNNLGSIYRVSPAGVIESLFSFNGTNGANPMGLTMGSDGAFYGPASFGGMGYNGAQRTGFGTIFRIDTNGTFSTVVTFNGTNGSIPYQLILGRDGAFYGVAHNGGASVVNFAQGYGTVFKLTPGGPLVTLHSFNNTDGAGVEHIIQGSDGALYGVAYDGGATATIPFGGNGTVYRITTDGVFTKLADCDAATKNPISIVQATDGTLYGSALVPGSIFRVDQGGMLTVVYPFYSSALPGYLVQIPGGAIYGTSTSGGIYSQGSIFRLDITPDPPLLQLASAQTNQLTLSWNTSVGHTYQVQSCGDLVQHGWTNFGSAFTATNTAMSISPIADPSLGGFYRVVLLP